MEMGESIVESIERGWTRLVEMAPQILLALVVFAATLFLARVVGRMVDALLARGELTRIQRGFFRLVAIRLVQVIGLAVILDVLGFSGVATWLAASGGIVAVILGFAFRQIGENFIAGVFLAYRSPFRVGDLIRSGILEGIVQSIDLRATHIRTADGTDIFIPNSKILNEPVVNYTLDGNLRTDFELRVGVEADLASACETLQAAVGSVPGVSSDPPPGVQLKVFEGAWARLNATLWVDVFEDKKDIQQVRTLAMNAGRRALENAGFPLEE